jgi:hypothetical protein
MWPGSVVRSLCCLAAALCGGPAAAGGMFGPVVSRERTAPAPPADPELDHGPAPADPTPRLDLVWYDPGGLAAPLYAAAADEVARVFGELGVAVGSTRAAPGEVTGARQLQVILLPRVQGALHPRTMGAAPRDAATQAVWVYLPNIAWALGLDPSGRDRWSPLQGAELALALGRVVCHELIHALAPRSSHATAGLMTRELNRATLLAPILRVDPRTRAELRDALAPRRAAPGDVVLGSREPAFP